MPCHTVGTVLVRTTRMWITAAILALSTWLLWKCLKGRRSTRKEPPGPWGLPLVGYLPFMDSERPNLTFVELAKKYGDVFQLRLGSKKMVVVNGQRACRQLYEKSYDFLSRPEWVTFRMQASTVDNYIFMPFTLRYWVHKKLLFRTINRFVTERSPELEEAVHKIVRMVANEIKKKNREPFDPDTLCKQVSCAMVFYHTYGRLHNISGQEVQEAMRIISDCGKAATAASKCNVFPWMQFLPTMWKPLSTFKTLLKLFREYLDKLAADVLDKRNEGDRKCFIDFLCQEAAQMDDEDKSILKVDKELIQKTSCNVGFFGAWRPLAIPMKWIFLLAALHPNVQKSVREEIHKKIGKNRQPGLRDADKLPYTTAAIREIFRYASVSALGAIKSTTCDTELDGYFIPKAVLSRLISTSLTEMVTFPQPIDPQHFLIPDGTLNADTYKDVIDTCLGPRRCGGLLMWLELYIF